MIPTEKILAYFIVFGYSLLLGQASPVNSTPVLDPPAFVNITNITGVPVSINIFEAEDNEDRLDREKRLDEDAIKAYQQNLGSLVDQRYFLNSLNLTTQSSSYGRCSVSQGHANNPGCQPGEVCVDRETLLPVLCPLGIGGEPGAPVSVSGTDPPPPAALTECAPCSGDAPPQEECPRGCKPGQGCPAPPTDGVCEDGIFPTDDYVEIASSSEEPTPMVFFSGRGQFNESCVVYGDSVDIVQKGILEYAEKSKILRTATTAQFFGSNICNWAISRLECIPENPRKQATTESGAILTQADIEEMRRVKGTCQCMLALGEGAVMVRNPETSVDICYIPANKGSLSECGHDISYPYGIIETLRKDNSPVIRAGPEPAAKFCVPNAECRSGYMYTGVRCMCKARSKWNPRTFTCSTAPWSKLSPEIGALFFLTVFLFLL